MWSSFLTEFLENIQSEDFGVKFLKKVKTEFFSKTVGYVYKEESFDTIFNICYGSGNSPMAERVMGEGNNFCLKLFIFFKSAKYAEISLVKIQSALKSRISNFYSN